MYVPASTLTSSVQIIADRRSMTAVCRLYLHLSHWEWMYHTEIARFIEPNPLVGDGEGGPNLKLCPAYCSDGSEATVRAIATDNNSEPIDIGRVLRKTRSDWLRVRFGGDHGTRCCP